VSLVTTLKIDSPLTWLGLTHYEHRDMELVESCSGISVISRMISPQLGCRVSVEGDEICERDRGQETGAIRV
jgi:hypothetical protein